MGEILQDNLEHIKNYYRRFREVRDRAQRNRSLNPNHPQYRRQFQRDAGRGIIAAVFAAGLTTGVVSYASGLESRSEVRAQELCALTRYRENIVAMDQQKGIDSANDFRVNNATSFAEIKDMLDRTNRVDDLLPVGLGAAVSITADVLAGLYLATPLINHRRKLVKLKK